MSIKGFDFNGVIHKYDYNALDNKPNMDAMIGSPLVAEDVASMTDTSRIYVYTGSETGYTNGNWYYYNGTSWVSGGVYNSVAISDAQIGGAVADYLDGHPEVSSEAWAVGQINGMDVDSTDTRYHNNSKYYAEQASASATTATTAANQVSADAAEVRQITANSLTFTEADTRANINSGESLLTMLGKIKKWFNDLGASAFRSVANNLTTASEGGGCS